MKRWITSVGLIAAVGCVQPTTSTTEQAVTNCAPSGNFKDAKLPAIYYWNGYTPQAGNGQVYLDFANPSVAGEHLVFLVDPGKGYVVWGAKVKDSQLKTLRSTNSGIQPWVGDCCRPPPPPPGGTDWLARDTLEFAEGFLSLEAASQAGADL